MKKAFVSVLTIALVITLLPLFSTNVSAADVEVSGTITVGGNRLSDVVVTATPSPPSLESPISDISDTDGKFSLILPAGEYTFTFEKAGFGVEDTFDVLSTDNKLTIIGTELSITLNVVMGEAFGGITGYVKNTNGDGLGDAKVEVMSGGKIVNHTTTDGNGFYSFDKDDVSDRILIGTYSVHVTRSDHEEQTINNVEVTKGVNTSVDFTLESKENTYILGLDLPHSLMIGGFVIGLIMLIGVSIYRKRLGEKLLGQDGEGSEQNEDDSQNE